MFATCPHCQKETLFTVEPVYDGFRKVAERKTCSACGKTLDGDSPPASSSKPDPLAALFGDDATPEKLNLFDVEEETGRLCRKCKHYVLHPFTQRCGLHDMEVQATDSCPQFAAKDG